MIQKIPLLIFATLLLLSCKSSNKSAQGPMQMNTNITTLSPGEIQAQFKILNVEASGSDSTPVYSIQILNVDKYGPSAPPLAKNEFVKILVQDISLQTKLNIGSIYKGTLFHSEKMSSIDQTPALELLSIK